MKKGLLVAIIATSASVLMSQVTLNNLLSAPFYNNIAPAPDGSKVAFVKNERGVRNIQIAEAPAWKPRNLTNFDSDDGLDINNLEWLATNDALVFVRGNAPQERAEEPHNPAHLMESTAPALWKVRLSDGKMERIGYGGAPSIFGDKLVFVRGGQVYSKKTDDTVSAKQLFQVRKGATQVRWSPDGTKLAFVTSRGEHSFVGVYDFSKNDYQFLDPSVDRDAEPCWSPDSKEVAFLRLPRNVELDVKFRPLRKMPAWSIRAVNIATGNARTLFARPDSSIGQAYQPFNSKQQLWWTATGHLVFCTEQTGWQQAYAVNVSDGIITALTSGEFEVDELILAPNRHQAYIVSNQNDMDRKHIYVLDFKRLNEGIKPLVTSKSIESNIAVSTDGKTLFAIQTTGTLPTRVVKISEKKVQVLTDLPATFPQKDLVEPEMLRLKARDSFEFHNQVFFPKNLKQDRSHPALIFVHGGPRQQMLMGYHPNWYYANAYHLSQYYAAQGIIVAHINYRSGIGYGWNFREAEGYGASGCAEFQDLEALGEWLKKHPSVNTSKMTVWGGSYGGYMTAHALARRSDLFAAGVDIHGVHNWNTEIPSFMPEYDSLRLPQIGQLAYRSSPMNYIDGWRSPVLLIHGDDDANVDFRESETLARALRRKGVDVEQLIIPDEVHLFLRYESWSKAYTRAAAFLERRVYKQ